ncbi:MAG: DUF4124 domain-containing protein [Gammaproteobacteria bacterium]
MKWLILLCGLMIGLQATAQQIYKSIDRDGRISYSSEPEKGAVRVEKVVPLPAPSPEEIESARQRYRELEARDAEREKLRREQELETLRREQILADLELKREIARQSSRDRVVSNPSPYPYAPYSYYWGRPYYPSRPGHRPNPRPVPVPQEPVPSKFPVPGRSPAFDLLGSP